MMGLGFEVAESFSGSYYRLDEPLRDHALRLSLSARVDGMKQFLRDRKMTAIGTIFAERLAERVTAGVALSGSLAMKLFDEKRIPYDLTFEGDDGRTYRLRGQRDFFVHDAVDSLTILPASLYDDAGVEVGRAVLRFDPKTELVPFLKSFRPRVRFGKRFGSDGENGATVTTTSPREMTTSPRETSSTSATEKGRRWSD